MIFVFPKIILFILSLALIKAEFKVENLTLKNEISKFNKLLENKYYYIKFNSSIPKYIKLLVRDNYFNTSNSDYINYIISYYKQDKTFTERNQISHQSYKSIDFIIMWLNYEQIKNGFYLSIESFNSTCNYSLEIYPYYEPELNPAEQYSYFVTKENKEMKFAITKKNFKLEKLQYFTIWAKGRENIQTSFSGIKINTTFGIDPNFTAFFIVIEDNEDFYGLFRIEANEGDYITIGTLVYKDGFKIDYYYDGIEYYGFLIKDLLTINCIPIEKLDGYKFLDYSHSFKEIDYTIYKSYPVPNTKACIDHNNKYDKIFYVLKTYSNKGISYQNFYKLYSIFNNYNSSSKDCYIFQKLYLNEDNSDKSDLNIFSIKEGSETNVFLESSQLYNYLSVETLSGKIEIKSFTSYSKKYSYKNIHTYILEKGLYNNLISLKIKGEKNSVYSIKLNKVSFQRKITDNNFGLNNFYIDLGENYLFNFPLYQYSVFKYLGNKNMFLSLYPIDCNAEIGYIYNDENVNTEDIIFTKLDLKNGFYQGLIYKESEFRVYSKSINSCLLYGSIFFKENKFNFTEIILEENFKQSFLLNTNYSNFKYYFFFYGKDENINIELEFSNKVEYKMNIFINECEKETNYFNEKNKNITIKENLWKDICKGEEKICKLSFDILLQNLTEKDTFLDITVKSKEKKGKLRTILVVVFGVLGLIILIALIFIVIRCIKKRKENEIEEISSGKDTRLMD